MMPKLKYGYIVENFVSIRFAHPLTLQYMGLYICSASTNQNLPLYVSPIW